MHRLFPQPKLSALLLAVWLLLNNSIASLTVLGGALLAVLIPLVTHPFWPEYPTRVRLLPLLRLLLIVAGDIIAANFAVAALVLGPQKRIKPGFVVVPLELEGELPITILASIITLTPGTLSANLSADRRSLLVHNLNLTNPDGVVNAIKSRYERPLREIFP